MKTLLQWLCDRVVALQRLYDWSRRGVPLGKARSSRWPIVRAQHLQERPLCEVCGGKKDVRVHHIKPFHLHPELELEPGNLITLCESGRYGLNCHLLIGHLGNFKRSNPFVRGDAEAWRIKLTPPPPPLPSERQYPEGSGST